MKQDVSEKIYQFVCAEYNFRIADQINYQYLSFKITNDQLHDPKLVHIKRNGNICANILIPGPRDYRKMLRTKPQIPNPPENNEQNIQQNIPIQNAKEDIPEKKNDILENQQIIGHIIQGQDLLLKLKSYDQEVIYNYDQLASNHENTLVDQMITYIIQNQI